MTRLKLRAFILILTLMIGRWKVNGEHLKEPEDPTRSNVVMNTEGGADAPEGKEGGIFNLLSEHKRKLFKKSHFLRKRNMGYTYSGSSSNYPSGSSSSYAYSKYNSMFNSGSSSSSSSSYSNYSGNSSGSSSYSKYNNGNSNSSYSSSSSYSNNSRSSRKGGSFMLALFRVIVILGIVMTILGLVCWNRGSIQKTLPFCCLSLLYGSREAADIEMAKPSSSTKKKKIVSDRYVRQDDRTVMSTRTMRYSSRERSTIGGRDRSTVAGGERCVSPSGGKPGGKIKVYVQNN